MDCAIPAETSLLLDVAVVARGPRCLPVMNSLEKMKTSRFQLRLVAIAPIKKCASCYKHAGERGVQVVENYMDLLSMDGLDLILELTGEKTVLADLIKFKKPSVGLLDRQASMLLFDLARLYSHQERHESEVTLAKSFASVLLDASPDGVLLIDKAHQIVDCNQSSLITTSKDKKSILGKHCFEVIYGAPCKCDHLRTYCPVQEARRTGKPARTVHEISDSDNTTLIRQVTAYPIPDRFGNSVRTLITVRDITQEVGDRIEQQTQALKKTLARVAQEDRLASLGRLVASVCHEINNPISSIVTFTKLVRSMIQLEDPPKDVMPKIEHYLDMSFREAMRCGSIVKNLLTFARPKSVEAKTIDMTELVDTVVLLTAHQAKLAEISCEVNLPPSPFTAWGDFGLLQQCLLNLVFNAIDAMPDGGSLTITGGTDTEADRIWLTVSDTGIGIDPQNLNRIFEPFFSTKLDGKGVGLGLSMVYGIIRAHGGTIEVESEHYKGTTFRLELPKSPTNDWVCEHIANTAFPVSEPYRPLLRGATPPEE